MEMKGKVAIVTGASQGIGLAVAKRFMADGVSVVIADLNENCVEVARQLSGDSGSAIGIPTDVSEPKSVANLFEAVLSSLGQVDILVNNAGITSDARFHKMAEEQWDRVLDINLKSMFLTCRNAIQVMLPAGKGAIVNIASISPQLGNFGQANYNASKMGVVGLTRTLCTEYTGKGIRANAVAPGFILTDMVKVIPDDIKKRYLSVIPAGRGGTPSEVAEAVYFLASDRASFISGQVLCVNGGQYLG